MPENKDTFKTATDDFKADVASSFLDLYKFCLEFLQSIIDIAIAWAKIAIVAGICWLL